jgi:ABC-type bacteriocin/lantibiotic exporter with double-glycine peptidase domain
MAALPLSTNTCRLNLSLETRGLKKRKLKRYHHSIGFVIRDVNLELSRKNFWKQAKVFWFGSGHKNGKVVEEKVKRSAQKNFGTGWAFGWSTFLQRNENAPINQLLGGNRKIG